MTSNNETVCWETSHWVFIIIPIHLWPTLNCPGESMSLVSLVPSSVFTARTILCHLTCAEGRVHSNHSRTSIIQLWRPEKRALDPKFRWLFHACSTGRVMKHQTGRGKTLKMGASLLKLPLTLNGVVWGHKHGKQLTTDSLKKKTLSGWHV